MTNTSISLGIAILGGSLTVLSPCVLPVLPILIGRSLSQSRWGPVALVAGLISGFAVTGSLLGITSSWFADFTNSLRIFAIILLLFMGLLSIFPKWSYQLLSYLQLSKFKKTTGTGLSGEFWLGTQLGLLWTPCAGPVLGSILVLAAVKHQITSAFGLLLCYGIGAGIPLLAIAYAGRYVSKSLLGLRAHSQTIQRIGGVVIAMTAIAILLGWDVEIQLWLAPLFPQQQL
jgi:cytochrome c-type biogenesis protein